MMRRLKSTLLLAMILPLLALAAEKAPVLEPLPEALPPPDGKNLDAPSSNEPVITTIKKGEDQVEEYRVHGELYLMKVTPPHGKTYYLYKEDSEGAWERFEGAAPPISVPKWVLFRF